MKETREKAMAMTMDELDRFLENTLYSGNSYDFNEIRVYIDVYAERAGCNKAGSREAGCNKD